MRNKLIPYNPKLKQIARILRRQGVLSEVLLWKQLQHRALGVEFHRQVPMLDYIVDFYCHELMLAVEIDGSSHDDEYVAKNDGIRQQMLEAHGVTFIRFADKAVKQDMANVMYALQDVIHKLRSTSP